MRRCGKTANSGENDCTRAPKNICAKGEQVDRKDDKFALFFHRLFVEMFKGRSMLMVWAELAPQIPGLAHPDAPDSIMAAEAGHITFQ